jgi:hypothetical protein
MSVIHRRFEAGADIAPLKVAELDQARTYCRSKVDAMVSAKPQSDDQALKESILNDADCPEYIKELSLQRPSVFDLLCSKTRFKPELFEMQRNLLLKLESKAVSENEAFNDLFKSLIPNSSTIIKDLQKTVATKANIQ